MLRAIIYTRVSSDPRGQARSVAEQETECRDRCVDQGWTVVGVRTDNDRSASRFATKDRLAFKQLLAAIDAGLCDVVVTFAIRKPRRKVVTPPQKHAARANSATRIESPTDS